MKIALINASPKLKNSNSELILSDLKHYLNGKCELIECKLSFNTNHSALLSQLTCADALVFAYPLYVDNMPSHLLKFLEFCDDKKSLIKKRVHAIANCGFYEGIQTKCSVNVINHWCNKTGNIYGGSVGIGGGEAFSALKNVPVGCGPKASIDKALQNLADTMINDTSTPDSFVNLNYPRFLYKFGATSRWKKEIKQNGGKIKDLDKKPSL